MTDIIILALISLILCIKLFFLFGQKRNIHRHPMYGCHSQSSCSSQIRIREVELNLEKITDPLTRIKVLDRSFNIEKFLQNAKSVYTDILNAYSKGDTQALSGCLNIDMLRKFAYEISKREEAGLNHSVEILKIKDAVVTNITCDKDGLATIQVTFHADIIHYKTNSANELVDGDKTKVHSKENVLTFSRNLKLSSQAWKLVEANSVL